MCTLVLEILLLAASVCGAVRAGCFGPGCCEDDVLNVIVDVATSESCLRLCQEERGCEWISYFESSRLCLFFRECSTMDESCGGNSIDDCYTASAECEVDGFVAFVVGGNNETVYGTGKYAINTLGRHN